MPQEVASAVHSKERQDEAQFVQLVIRGVPTVATTKGGQGGMNATYRAALKANGGPGSDIRTSSGTIPSYVHPPTELSSGESTASLSSFTSPAARASQPRALSVEPSSIDGVKLGTAETPASPQGQPY